MAAYSNLLSLENTINQILDHDRFSISPHEEKHIRSLHKCVISLQAFLEDFPEKAKILEKRIRDVAEEKAKILETRIRDVADDAEDIIQLFLDDQLKCRCIYTKRISTPTGTMFNYQLQIVREKMDSIANKAVEIKNSIIVENVQVNDYVGANSSSSSSPSSSQATEAEKIKVVGLNEDLKVIRDNLCGLARQLQILPISGMGGIGKTTLARLAYNDHAIVEHFQIRAWITVSQDYSEQRIILQLTNSIKKIDEEWKEEDMEEIDKLRVKVHKILTSRRFLIVIDDIWSTKVMDGMKHLFPNSNNGSRIMLTTRLKEVATYTDSPILILHHEMRLMDADQSWNLLCQKVFTNQDCIPRKLESIAKEIARSCGGLPLAIVVIAGLLSTVSRTVASWEEVARNIRPSLVTADGEIIEKILHLSYDHLPHRLRPCFLYMGGFPEDHEIKVTDLIRLWIAESFVKADQATEFENTAEEYLEDLVDKSLIMVTKRKSNGKIKCCSLHDMVREMCIKLSKEDNFLVQVKCIGELRQSMRRISIGECDINYFEYIHTSTVRSMLYIRDLNFCHPLTEFSCFKLLKVLYVQNSSIAFAFFLQFSKLFHLRYLTVSCACWIPREISNLISLETLVIRQTMDKVLPYEIWNMRQLRHLSISYSQLADTVADTSALENLLSLSVRNLPCSKITLNLIPNLTKLRITYSQGSGELLFHNLEHLRQLENLYLGLVRRHNVPRIPNLVLPRSLKILTLFGWGRREPYLEIVGPFPSLEVLKLKCFNFMGGLWSTTEEDFPQLKYLHIANSDLKQWETERSHLPRLKALHIRACFDLTEIPICFRDISPLELIELQLCTETLAESAKLIQEDAQNYTGDVFQVRCIDCKPIEELLLLPSEYFKESQNVDATESEEESYSL